MNNQPILCHRPLHVEGRRKRRKGQGREEGIEGWREEGREREGGKEGGKTGQVGGVGLCPRLPGLCTRCLWRAGLLQP